MPSVKLADLFVAAFLAALLAGSLEVLFFLPDAEPASAVTVLAMWAVPALLVLLPLCIGLAVWKRVRPGRSLLAAWPAPGQPRPGARAAWTVMVFLLLMAFVPFPVLLAATRAASTLDDVDLLVTFSSAVGVLAVAASIALSALLAWAVTEALSGSGRLGRWPGPALFYCFGFPLPWLVVPMAVVALDPGPLDRAARGLLPLLFAALVPPLLLASARLGPRFRTVAAAGLTALQLGLLASAASPALFDEEATRASPGAATWFSLVRSVADPDRDGHMVLFDGRDCDEGDPGVNAVAYDIPGDGVDRDCDGADGVADTPAARGVYLGGEPPNPHGRPRKYNVLFVLMDSLRADHLELGGYFRQTAPNLEMLAVESLVFTNARAQYPSTGISLPSLLSGRYPEYMEWSVPGHPRRYSVGKRNMLLPQILRPAGYRTSAVLVPWVVGNVLGLASRFDDVYPSYAPGQWRKYNTNGSPAVVTRALEALAQRREGKPFFLFVHMEEPHRPYANHPAPGRVFGQSPEDRYDSDIYWADLWLGFLLGVMRESGLMDDTVVIVAADHGEAFGEHGTRQHGRQLYEESIRLPIFLRIPGQEEGRVITTPVALVDIVPTVLDLTGVEFPRSGLQGVSLLRTADGEAPDRPVFSMVADREVRPTRHVKAVTQGGYKYLRDMGSGGEELYDLAADPGEEVNLVDQRRDVVGRMRATLDAYLEDADPSWKVY